MTIDRFAAIANPRELLEGLFEHSPLAYEVLEANGRCLLVNPAFVKLFHSTPPADYSVFEDDIIEKNGFAQLVRRAFAGETVEIPPHWYDPRDLESVTVEGGRRVGIAVTMFPLRGGDGRVDHVALCFRDVTAELLREQERDLLAARHQAVLALRESEALNAAVLEASLDAIVMMDAGGLVIEFSPAAERILGTPRSAAIGRPLADLMIPPAARAAHHAGLARLLETGTAKILGRRLQTTAMRGDGTEFPAEVAVVRSETEGSPIFIGYVRDITERERAATALRESEERLRRSQERLLLAQQIAHVGTFEWDARTNKTTWTPELEQMHGLAPGELAITQDRWQELVHPEDRAAATALRDRAFTTADPVEGEWRVRWPDGSVHWLVARFQCVRNGEDAPHRLIGVNVDITARKQIEDEVRRLNTTLEQQVQERTSQLVVANSELEAFSYSVAHDLRAPLRAMDGFARILVEEHAAQLDSVAKQYLTRIHSNALLMSNLIDALLSLAQLTRSELQPRMVDVSARAREIASRLRAGEPERAVEITVQDDLRAFVDTALAQTVLENLLENAWKFTRNTADARIEVGITEVEGVQAMFVRDNGAGFEMTYSNKLFAPFHRLHAHTEFPGTGIGLATVRRIVERHGGRVWAEGIAGRGATFYFTLPAEATR